MGLCCSGTRKQWGAHTKPSGLEHADSPSARPLNQGKFWGSWGSPTQFCSLPALFSILSGSDSVTGFHPVIISTGTRRTSQASQTFLNKSPVRAMQNWSTTGTTLSNTHESKALLQESCTTGPGWAGSEAAARANVLGVSKPVPISGLREKADAASTLSHWSARPWEQQAAWDLTRTQNWGKSDPT